MFFYQLRYLLNFVFSINHIKMHSANMTSDAIIIGSITKGNLLARLSLRSNDIKITCERYIP